MKKRDQKIKITIDKPRNHTVVLVIKKTGAGKHKDKKKESKNTHSIKEFYHE